MHADPGEDRRGVGFRIRLHDHPAEGGDAAVVEIAQQVLQRIDQFAAHGAAHAAAAKRHDPVVGAFDQRTFETHRAELVEDHGGVGEGRSRERPVDQRRLAGTERPGDDGERDRRLAGARHGRA